ncbi:7,8-didemethyl-8-hydroxy-5-deazariboflavin synthase subunit CofG [Coleofasciculus sp. LEGE 07092]|nr:7,8-didemethyl-8-hydroxy-5-deazariboflavin synthase subunit CofG [Coleofasciculus sp. LEGE 07081]MBE9147671.1 7,8-didemethyl-8-hydroxy-5-deazariboflavin synthase subunit CofG [Coleofasciculus sp. LEGE 07092]
MSDSRTVTYSPAYTLVPTYECFNRCTYCNFRTDPGQSPWLTLTDAERTLKLLQNQSICEILILSGEVHPNSPQRQSWFQRIYDLCELALSMGFLPHTNAGPLSFEEMRSLKQVNVSMGLMLEQLTPQLLQTVHRHAPSKIPEVRLQQLAWTGELEIPFTTGLLLGIGETPADWWDTLEAIARFHSEYGNIQEVILQPHSPGSQQSWDASAFNSHQLPDVIAKARHILPSDITLQIPPNLVSDSQGLLACLDAGVRDLGGIVPKDEVNPDYSHLHIQELKEILEPAGWELVPRLPVYPQYDRGLPLRLQEAVKRWRHD